MLQPLKTEYAHERKIRERNKLWYRVAHWPLWIWVFFLAPGPLTFRLFQQGVSRQNVFWLGVVMLFTGIAGLFGQLPGVEQRPYILRFCEDKPNPLYRKVCYTFAWNDLLSFAILNLAGLIDAALYGRWRLQQIYVHFYFPLAACILLAGAFGLLPRAGRSTKGEGFERRYFYAAVWSITIAQTALLVLWKSVPRGHAGDVAKLAIYLTALLAVGVISLYGLLPRTRPILPGELIVAD